MSSITTRNLVPGCRLPTWLVAPSLILALVGASTASAQSGGVTPPGGAPAPAPAAAAAPKGQPPARSAQIVEARARPKKAYFYGLKPVRFEVTLRAKQATDLRIDILGARSGTLLRSVYQLDVAPGTAQRIVWDGLSSTGSPLRGKLRFEVRGINGEAIPMARSAPRRAAQQHHAQKPGAMMRFGLFDYIFPVRGRHSYGDGLGAGRGHQGQDLPAACGTKIVAAQGGTVKVNAYQASGAGYYVVLDTIGSDVDHTYFHMLGPSPLGIGQVVKTGQQIGQVGTTGHSTGCHLHFEAWSTPGWIVGSPLDPTPMLRAWDRYS